MSRSELVNLFLRELQPEIASGIEQVMRDPGTLVFHRIEGNVVDLLLDFNVGEAVLQDVLGDLEDEHLSFAELFVLLDQWCRQDREAGE